VLISKTDDIEFFSDFPFFGLKGEVRIEMLIRIFNQHNHNSFILLKLEAENWRIEVWTE
jgi:hypothetical protein